MYMQIISLNTWGARAGIDNLLAFFEHHKDVDVFCLQEIWNGGEHMLDTSAAGRGMEHVDTKLLTKIAAVLDGHVAYFRPSFFDFWGLTIFVKIDIRVREEGERFIYQERGYISEHDIADHARHLQYITIDAADGPRTIINLHAAWQANGKDDTPARLLQSNNIVEFTKTLNHPFILCGDFNLLPTTKSIQILESTGLRNLIREYGITSTRTSFCTKPIRFADYTFVSPELRISNFQILPDEVSDHSAMYLECE
jgi:exonuclease III